MLLKVFHLIQEVNYNMANQHIFGWGGLVLGDDGLLQSFTFPNAMCHLYFQKVNTRNTGMNGKFYQTKYYYRPIIEVQFIDAGQDVAGTNVYELVLYILNNYINNLLIIPNYSETNEFDNSYDNSYLVYLDSDISFIQNSERPIGQNLKLKFIGKDLVTSIPTNYSHYEYVYMIADDGSYIVDHTGDNLILNY